MVTPSKKEYILKGKNLYLFALLLIRPLSEKGPTEIGNGKQILSYLSRTYFRREPKTMSFLPPPLPPHPPPPPPHLPTTPESLSIPNNNAFLVWGHNAKL